MGGMKIDRKQRYAATRSIQNQGTLLVHVEHELWRVVNVEKNGLTPKEKDYMEKRLSLLKKVREDISKLGSHLQSNL
jgi:hypothetical protein